MKVHIRITNSKMMAYALLVSAVYLDITGDKSGTVFMFTIPFIVTLITGKQYLDRKNEKNQKSNSAL